MNVVLALRQSGSDAQGDLFVGYAALKPSFVGAPRTLLKVPNELPHRVVNSLP